MRKSNLPQKLAEIIQLPKDLVYREPVLTMIGQKEVCIENYKSVRYYTETCIILMTKHGELRLEGDKLSIESYNNEEINITGMICRLEFV